MALRTGSSEGGRVSVVNYDGRRLVTSPTSLEACRLEGILPESLLVREAGLRPKGAEDPYAECRCTTEEELQMKKEFIEQRRRALVRTVEATREKLLSTKRRGGNNKLPAIAKVDKAQPSTASATAESVAAAATSKPEPSSPPLSPSKRSPRQPRATSPGSFHNVTLPADTVTVAHYFTMLQQEAQRNAERQARWEKKQQAVEEKQRNASLKRSEKAAALAAARDARLDTTLKRAADLEEQRLHTAEERTQHIDAKLKTISIRRSELRSRSRPTASPVTRERQIAAKKEEDRLALIKSKLEAANEASRQLQLKAQKEREKASFLAELQNCAHHDQAVRAERAKSYRTFVIEHRIEESASKRRAAEQQREAELFERALQREVLNRQKQEVTEYVAKNAGRTSPLQVPAWLEPQMSVLHEKTKASSARGPRPPSSPRSETAPSTARSRPFVVREPFTVGGVSDISPKQAFAPWMFQSF